MNILAAYPAISPVIPPPTLIKISSLENIYEQSKNRYSVNLKNKNTELYLGDFNPYFNSYILNGQRVRGFSLNSNNNVLFNNLSLSINFIKGELNRVVQGNPSLIRYIYHRWIH